MKYFLIPIVILILGFALFIFSGCKKKPPVNVEDLEKIVDKYCAYVAEGAYDNAYNECMNSRYKKDVPLDKFTEAHEKRKESLGVLQEKKMNFKINTYNIFSGLREYQFTYELKYGNATNHEVIKLNDEDGIFLIEGTYTRSSSETLRFMVW